MNRRNLIIAALIGVVFVFAGYNLYSYFQTQAEIAAEEERLEEERRIERERQRAEEEAARQAEQERLASERAAQEERERQEAAAREAEAERLRLEAEARVRLEQEAREAERLERERAQREERIARARAVTEIEGLGDDAIAAIRGLSPRYIRDNPGEFLDVFPGLGQGERVMGVDSRILLQGGSTTLMVFAAVSQNTDVLQALMDIGVDINAANELGFTALMFAAAYNHPEIVAFLVSSGADSSAQAYDRDLNALHVASLLHPDPAMVEVLVEAGLPLEEPVTTGETPLVLAVTNNPNLEVAERLVELGADTSASGEGGQLVGALLQARVARGAPVFRRIDEETTQRILEALEP